MKKTRTKPPKRGGGALWEGGEFLAGLLDSTNLVVYLKDVEGRYLYVNRRYERLAAVPREAVLGKRDHDLFPKEVADLFRTQVAQVAARRAAIEFEETIPLPGGVRSFLTEKFPLLDEKGAVYATGGFCTEITAQKKRADEELYKVRSLESLGFLAGGIAHDFNNLLTGILGNLELLREEAASSGAAREIVDDARRICEKASALSRQLLTFADGGTPVRRTFAPAPLLRDAARLILHDSNVRSRVSVADDLWHVDGDDAQVTQVLGNILVNAREAMPDGGTVWISGENHELAEATPQLPAGRYVKISVRDEGPGIPAEILARIFNPYFSSKKRGSGLGLAIVYSVVRRHGGHVWAESAEGEGAVFSFLLPAAKKPAAGRPAPARAGFTKGKGRVLVMDDERAVAGVARKVLVRAGYTVRVEREGAGAVAAYRKALAAGRRFAAVVLDLTVPLGMGGAEAAENILALDPKARIILSSGYAEDEISRSFPKSRRPRMLLKPYTIRQLTETVAAVVRRRA